MNLFSYIDKYGCYTFDEVSFNEVDNVIFSMLSYLNLDGIVSRNKYNPLSIKEVGNIYLKKYKKQDKSFLSLRQAIKILKNIKDTRRYGDLFLYNYIYETSGESQFGALTIEINKRLVYVSFEGTDHLVGGWREDFMLSYQFPVLSQRRAIDYVNKNFLFRRKNIILGGHSKGGNLALVAGMYANFLVRDKIVAIYNNDGPGLLKEQFESKFYKNVEKKLVHIVPNFSVIGLLLKHGDNINVVRSFRRSIISHDPVTWIVRDKEFERNTLSSFSEALDEEIDEWLANYSMEERKFLVNSMFDIFDRIGVDSFSDLVRDRKLLLNFISETKKLDDNTANMIKSFVKTLVDCFKTVTKDEVISLVDKNKKDK